MPTTDSQAIIILGITSAGKTFRPSDWAERLAGVMSQFRPQGAGRVGGLGAHVSYSPWCTPNVAGGVKCVIVQPALREHERMAWDFVMNFARDNDLQITHAHDVPSPPPPPQPTA